MHRALHQARERGGERKRAREKDDQWIFPIAENLPLTFFARPISDHRIATIFTIYPRHSLILDKLGKAVVLNFRFEDLQA